MGNTYPITTFPVVKTVSSTTVTFTITDNSNQLTTTKLIRAVLGGAIDTWIASERSDLDATWGGAVVTDSDVKGSDEHSSAGGPVGGGFSKFSFTYSSKSASVTLNSISGISVSGTITQGIPFADVT